MFYAKQNWKDVGSKVSSFQKADKFTDIELLVEGQVFRGHKVILASASAYFETMFSTELCEKDKTRIEIHGIKRELFQQLFEYIYKQKFEINEDNVQEILDASNMLQLTCLTSSCCKFLKKKLNEKNVVDIFRLADLYSSTESLLSLKRKCKFFIEQHFLNIIKSPDFLDLPFHLFENLIKSESLNIHNELDVLKITLNWILKDPDERSKHIYALMRSVRLPVIPEEKKEIIIENLKNVELKQILREILRQDLHKAKQPQQNGYHPPPALTDNEEFRSLISSNLRWKSRIKCSNLFYLVGGRNESTVIADIMRINSFDFKFTHLKRLSVSRFNHQTCELNGLLYIAGGMNSSQIHLKLVEAFDPYENEKVSTSFMVNSRQDFGLVNFNGSLLAIGGSPKYSNLVERFDPKTNLWSPYDSIDELPVRGFRVVKVDSKIFIIGGLNRYDRLLDQTLCYDPETKQVKRMSRMNESRASFGCTFSFGFIYVIGGSNSRSCERYSLAQDQWCYIAELDRPIENCCVTVAFNRILMIGGEDPTNKQPQKRIDCYDPECNKWSQFKVNLPFKLCGTSLVRI